MIVVSHAPATYKDIRRLTGLSLSTISNYYNGRSVLAKNRAAIERAAAELGYRVNTVARSLRRGVSRTVGVVLPSLLNEFHLSVVVEVEKCLRGTGVGVLVTSSDGGREAREDAVGLLLSRQVDGIISVPAAEDLPALAVARAAGVPVVTIDWWLPTLGTDTVSLDNTAAGGLAARHLLDHGHTDIAILAGPESISTMRERFDGFSATFASARGGLPADRAERAPLTVPGGHDGMVRLLSLAPRPTAVFTANHELTVGALIAVNESGLRLGRDISLIGLDAEQIAQTTRPRLTVIVQPVTRIAAEAARIMAARLADPATAAGEPAVVRLPGRLVAGGSVASLRDEH